jgi:23S rRNA (uracil1939-C5)-methyltransferase
MNLRIEKAIYGGDGLARESGKAIFVPGVLPGELVRATTLSDRRGFSTARLEEVLEPSPERVSPPCEYVPRCGGCHYQHANSLFQPRMKLEILRETLARARVAVPEQIEVVSGPPWAYRNRIRLHAVPGGLAYRERGSHRLLPVSHCPIAAPVLEKAVAVLANGRLSSICEEVELFTNGEQLLLSLWPGEKQRVTQTDLEDFAGEIAGQLPELAGAGVFLPQRMLHWGDSSLAYSVAGVSYQVSLGSFFQVNRFLLPQLVELVTGGRQGRAAWDLYAGVGLFARALACEFVTAVEAEGASARDLQTNLSGKHRVLRSGTLEFLRSPAAQKRPDLIIVDPPRAGLGKEVCNQLARAAAPQLVYVSCDPATLARDLQLLHGYSIETLHLVDLFPQTFHLESVVSLRRN